MKRWSCWLLVGLTCVWMSCYKTGVGASAGKSALFPQSCSYQRGLPSLLPFYSRSFAFLIKLDVIRTATCGGLNKWTSTFKKSAFWIYFGMQFLSLISVFPAVCYGACWLQPSSCVKRSQGRGSVHSWVSLLHFWRFLWLVSSLASLSLVPTGSPLKTDCLGNVMRLSLDKALETGNQLEVEAVSEYRMRQKTTRGRLTTG